MSNESYWQQQPQPQQPQPQPQPAPMAGMPGAAPAAAYAQAPAPVYVAAPTPAPKKRRGWIVAIVCIVMFALVLFGISSCTASMMGSAGAATGIYSPNTVAVIDIDSTIQYDNSANSPEGLKYLLDIAEEDNNIKAVVLRVDSGGGTATAGEEMAGYVHDFSKPIVVSSASLNASAAYMISSQADSIYVAKTTEIGAIGTVLQVSDYSGLMEMLGINTENIASSDSKDSTYGTRPLTDEERAYYQDMVNQINDVFVGLVAEGRNMSDGDARALATGLTFTGVTAVENGLADEVGTLEDAETAAAKMAGLNSFNTKHMDELRSSDLSSLLGLMGASQQSGTGITAEQLAEALKELNDNETVAR